MSYDKKILIIPDSNHLYVNFNQKADFREFSFNNHFDELIQLIEKCNLQDKCVIGLSEVVLEELLIQRVEAYNEQIEKIKQLTTNYDFPHLKFDVSEADQFKYVEFITRGRTLFISTIKSKLIEFIDLPIPDQNRFSSIIRRAFDKRPPFEGTKGKSDKGFKDALLWESILDIRLNSDYSNVIVCTSDERLQSSKLIKEFNDINPNIHIEMVRSETLYEILKSLISENNDNVTSINTLQEITNFLSSNTDWKTDIRLEDPFLSGELVECSVLDFEILDYDILSDDKFNVLVNLQFELIDVAKNKITKFKKANLSLQYTNSEWFYIQYSFEGYKNE